MSPSSSSASTHYDTLGVPKGATPEEIKAAFRKLSLETHPDLNKDTSCSETFKRIANAHSVLSSAVERRQYDRQLQEEAMWRGHSSNNGNFYGGGNFHHRPGRRQPKPGMHVVMETLSNPRYILLGVAGFGGMALVGSLLGGLSSNRPAYHHEEPMVEAWQNPHTGRWEQPAPWDPLYQKLRPKLEMVPREKVRRRVR